ncbi:hypothetical protein ACNKHV_10935 [Shigella flexneri]
MSALKSLPEAGCFPHQKAGTDDAFRYPQGVKLDQENSVIFAQNWAGCATGIAVRSRVL